MANLGRPPSAASPAAQRPSRRRKPAPLALPPRRMGLVTTTRAAGTRQALLWPTTLGGRGEALRETDDGKSASEARGSREGWSG